MNKVLSIPDWWIDSGSRLQRLEFNQISLLCHDINLNSVCCCALQDAASAVKAEEEAAKIKKEAATAEEKNSKLSFPDHFANAVDTLFDRVPALEPLRSTVLLHPSRPTLHRLAMMPLHSVQDWSVELGTP